MSAGTASKWREHIAGPVLCGALLCARCGQVLWVNPGDDPRKAGPWPAGVRIASDGEHSRMITGWPYTECEPWQPKVGDRIVRDARTEATQ